MRSSLLRVGAAAAFAALAALPARAEFSDAERAAIRDEVRAYLLENPDILRDMIALLEIQEREGQATADRELIAANAEQLFDDGFSYVGGNPEGSLTMVEFLDYQCSFCRRAHPDVAELLDRDGDIRWIVKELPILGPGSELASRAAVATLIAEGPAAYARLGDALMGLEGGVSDVSLDVALMEADLDPDAIRAAMEDEEVTRRIAETRALADAMGISGTPTFVIEDRMVRGFLPLADMESLVAGIRAAN